MAEITLKIRPENLRNAALQAKAKSFKRFEYRDAPNVNTYTYSSLNRIGLMIQYKFRQYVFYRFITNGHLLSKEEQEENVKIIVDSIEQIIAIYGRYKDAY